MGSKRVDEPLITINAMVRVGPWTVEQVLHGTWRNCDRCGADHKEVWVCTVDADDEAVGMRLGGQRTWRIGSTCGPTLMMVSEIEWSDGTKDLQRIVRLALRATRVVAWAREEGYGEDSLLPYVVEDLELLKKGELGRLRQKRMGVYLRLVEGWLDAKAEAVKAGSPAPPTPHLLPAARDRLDQQRRPRP